MKLERVPGYGDWFAKGRKVHASPPPPPPKDFSDNLRVTPEQWQLLQDVELVMTKEEIRSIQDRARAIWEVASAQIERQKAAANGKDKAK